ncbi:retron system putative HNH endonuclease [Telluria beijingensis]|uniref:retron system putative HNH endonuclease n=1 Tax=Telluria beijingensis TaxID=3068633 RepID=UPI002795D087|nr:retron system putative HNH endonuclease [Massilia sp. REN29]
MRTITQAGNGGFQLNRSHANPPLTSDQATSRWRGFVDKSGVLERLLEEQFRLCCYSELRADREGLGYHIEHIENKHQNPALTFDFKNLAASALASAEDLPAFKAQGLAVFGGHASGKQQSVDMARFVSCYQPDCREYFAFLSDGRIVPRTALSPQDRDKAEYTIGLLNLDSPYLITRRRQWWTELEDLYDEHQRKGWSLEHLIAIDLVPRARRPHPILQPDTAFLWRGRGADATDACPRSAIRTMLRIAQDQETGYMDGTSRRHDSELLSLR